MSSITFSNSNRQAYRFFRSLPLFLGVFGVYLLFSPAHFISTPDEELNLRTTLSLLEGRKGAVPPLPMGFASKTGIDGKEYAQYGLGLPLAAAPWCAAGLLLDPSAEPSANQLANVTPLTEAGTPFLRYWMTVFAMMISALSVVLFNGILLTLGMPERRAMGFSLLYAFTTYAWVHGRTFFTEPLVAFCWLAALRLILQARQQNFCGRWLLYAGGFWAYALLTRFDVLVTLPAAAWFLLVRESAPVNGRRAQRFHLRFDIKQLVPFLAPFIAVVMVILLYNQYRFDALFSTGYEDQAEDIKFITPLFVGLHGFLFTPGRSLFLYSPPLIFFGWGIAKLWWRDRWFCIGLLMHITIFLAVMCKWQNWAGGYDWGPRHNYQLTPLFMLLSAMAFVDRPLATSLWHKLGWVGLAALGGLMQLLGLSADPTQTIRDFLARWPEAQITPVLTTEAVMKQFNVYLPQFSSPVLHWQSLWANGPDLIVFTGPTSAALSLLVIGLMLIAAGCGIFMTGRESQHPPLPAAEG